MPTRARLAGHAFIQDVLTLHLNLNTRHLKGDRMGKLADVLLSETIKPDAVKDFKQFITDTVKSKKGVSGMVIGAGFKALMKMSPNALDDAVQGLFPEYAEVLDGYYTRFDPDGNNDPDDFPGWVNSFAGEIADAFLAINDRVVLEVGGKPLAKVYYPIKKIAKKHTVLAIPGTAEVAVRHFKKGLESG